MDRTGQLIDEKYKLLRLLGEGGMGAVYEAEHAVIGKRCAVKFLHPEVAANQEVVKRFIREAQAAAAIGHRGICDVYDVGKAEDGSHYIVMEYLDGASLGDHVAGGKKLPPAQAVELIVQALSALAVAHRRGIVHRDLKPDNLYVVQTAEGLPATKLLDFGISKMTLGTSAADHMTRPGTVLGTPYYMAPEQAAGRPDVDHRADIYSMGVILYEILAGRVPFEGDNYQQLLVQILTESPPKPRELEPSIPDALEAVILKAMARDKEERYQDCETMIRALVPFLGSDSRSRLGLPLGQTAAVQRLSRTPPVGAVQKTHTPLAGAAKGTVAGAPAVSRAKLVAALSIVAVVLVAVLVFLLVRPGGQEGQARGPAAPSAPGPAGSRVAIPASSADDAAAGAKPVPADAGTAAPAPDVAATAAVEAATPPVAAAEAGAAEVAPAVPSDLVTISFKNLPEGAAVLYDGARVTVLPFSVKRSTAAVVIEVRAEGYEAFKELIVPDQDREIELQLVATGGAGPRDVAAVPRLDAGVAPRPDAGVASRPDAGERRLDTGPTVVVVEPDTAAPPPPPPAADAGARRDGLRTEFPGRDTGAGGADATSVRVGDARIRTGWP